MRSIISKANFRYKIIKKKKELLHYYPLHDILATDNNYLLHMLNSCVVCSRDFEGRVDAKFCSSTCRSKGSRMEKIHSKEVSKMLEDGLSFSAPEKEMNGENKPPLEIDDKFLSKYKRNKALTLHNSPTLTKLTAADRTYLRGMWEIFKANLPPPGLAEYDTKQYRYQPWQMWENIQKYFEFSIDQGQPLTISGMALFCGMGSPDMFKGDKLKDGFGFLKDCKQFIEMYNEYAAHKKMNPAGPIFILKNFGWKDKFDIEASSTQGALTEAERTEMQKRLTGFSEGLKHGTTLPAEITG